LSSKANHAQFTLPQSQALKSVGLEAAELRRFFNLVVASRIKENRRLADSDALSALGFTLMSPPKQHSKGSISRGNEPLMKKDNKSLGALSPSSMIYPLGTALPPMDVPTSVGKEMEPKSSDESSANNVAALVGESHAKLGRLQGRVKEQQKQQQQSNSRSRSSGSAVMNDEIPGTPPPSSMKYPLGTALPPMDVPTSVGKEMEPKSSDESSANIVVSLVGESHAKLGRLQGRVKEQQKQQQQSNSRSRSNVPSLKSDVSLDSSEEMSKQQKTNKDRADRGRLHDRSDNPLPSHGAGEEGGARERNESAVLQAQKLQDVGTSGGTTSSSTADSSVRSTVGTIAVGKNEGAGTATRNGSQAPAAAGADQSKFNQANTTDSWNAIFGISSDIFEMQPSPLSNGSSSTSSSNTTDISSSRISTATDSVSVATIITSKDSSGSSSTWSSDTTVVESKPTTVSSSSNSSRSDRRSATTATDSKARTISNNGGISSSSSSIRSMSNDITATKSKATNISNGSSNSNDNNSGEVSEGVVKAVESVSDWWQTNVAFTADSSATKETISDTADSASASTTSHSEGPKSKKVDGNGSSRKNASTDDGFDEGSSRKNRESKTHLGYCKAEISFWHL
jgi:hypothetical protein